MGTQALLGEGATKGDVAALSVAHSGAGAGPGSVVPSSCPQIPKWLNGVRYSNPEFFLVVENWALGSFCLPFARVQGCLHQHRRL